MKFVTKKPPIVTNSEKTYKRSLNLHIALIVAALGAIVLNGLYAYPTVEGELATFADSLEQSFKVFSMVLLASGFSLIVELFYALTEGDTTKFGSYKGFVEPINIGILIALLLPITTPIYVLALTVFVGVYIGKLVFGGYGFYIFNPALVGALFAYSAFGNQLALTGETPLQLLKLTITENQAFTDVSFLNLLVGNYLSTAVGSTSVILLGLLFIYLLVTKVIDLRISGTYLLTVLAISLGVGFILYGNDPEMALAYVLVNLVTGLAVFGAVFFVSETVSTPTSRETKIIYAVTVASLMMVFRTLSGNVEGLLYAVLFGNMITPFLNRTVKQSNRKALTKTVVFSAILVIVVTLAIGFMLQGQLKEALSTVESFVIGGII